MAKKEIEAGFWDALNELNRHFFNRFGCELSNVKEAKKIIDDEYARKKGKNLSELNGDGELPSVSTRTLRYYWRKDGEMTQKEKEGKSPNISTLDIICICVGYATWDDFCLIMRRNKITEDSLFNPEDYIVEKMEKGKTYIIGWFPCYFIELEYLGNYEFKVKSHSYNLRKRYDRHDKLTIYGFGLHYLPHIDEVSDSENKVIDGYPLYPTIFIRKTQQKIENIEYSYDVYVCS